MAQLLFHSEGTVVFTYSRINKSKRMIQLTLLVFLLIQVSLISKVLNIWPTSLWVMLREPGLYITPLCLCFQISTSTSAQSHSGSLAILNLLSQALILIPSHSATLNDLQSSLYNSPYVRAGIKLSKYSLHLAIAPTVKLSLAICQIHITSLSPEFQTSIIWTFHSILFLMQFTVCRQHHYWVLRLPVW